MPEALRINGVEDSHGLQASCNLSSDVAVSDKVVDGDVPVGECLRRYICAKSYAFSGVLTVGRNLSMSISKAPRNTTETRLQSTVNVRSVAFACTVKVSVSPSRILSRLFWIIIE